MKQIPQQIYLGQELWSDELVTRLVGLGHSVTPFNTAPGTLIISRHAWRIPKSVTINEVIEQVGMILKQARLLEHEGTSEESASGGADKKPKQAAKRKRSTKAKAGIPGVQVSEGTGSEGRSTGPVESANPTRDHVEPEKLSVEEGANESGC